MLVSTRTTNILLVLVLAIGIAVMAMAASSARGGQLDPPGPVVSTMKSLDVLVPSWSRTLPANDTGDNCKSSRFTCVFGDTAVLDQETGLVWQRTPSEAVNQVWSVAVANCRELQFSGRYGWRLPFVEEYQSLQPLPAGNPFTNVRPTGFYWSASTVPDNSTRAYVASLGGGAPYPVATDGKLSTIYSVWCVRGGPGLDGM